MELPYFIIFLITAIICSGFALLAGKFMIRKYVKLEEKERREEEERQKENKGAEQE